MNHALDRSLTASERSIPDRPPPQIQGQAIGKQAANRRVHLRLGLNLAVLNSSRVDARQLGAFLLRYGQVTLHKRRATAESKQKCR